MKKELKTERTRERILSAAQKEFGEKGYISASLNTICGTGISKGLIYHNFTNKDSLYLACVERCFTKLTQYLKDRITDLDLHYYMEVRLHFFRQNENDARLFFEALLKPPVHLKSQIQKIRTDFDHFNLDIYQRILSSIPLREGITETDAMEYFTFTQTMFNGYFSSLFYDQSEITSLIDIHEKELSKILDYMIYGIAKRRDEK